ncbi:O-antigen ligase family protein [Blautia sp. MSJ-19]|uniref:O-antigen ligase family protein n=1 Tax=Blautia sp. MSJ-19 TaxID=2841517 RepID=UPI001C0F1D7E|nr:O-antigen ligase family protein [Blautia sp. MSJ-19]MBU5480118.1 O-antigen ligase family protein [Blautia sp. MSJ-19]
MKKIRISEKTFFELLYLCYAIVVLNAMNSMFYNTFSSTVVIVFGMAALTIVVLSAVKKRKMNRLLKTGMGEIVVPFFIVTIISCLSAIAVHHTSNFSDVTMSFLRFIQVLSIFSVAYFMIAMVGKKSLDILLWAACISYASVILNWLQNCIASGSWDTTLLESHGLIESVGLLFIYFFLSKSYTSKQRWMRCIPCLVILLMGAKRVAWIGIAWSLIIYFLFHKFKERRNRIIRIIMLCYVILAFVYLYLIKNNYFDQILSYFGIADNMRLSFWNYFKDAYQLSPFYLGRGIQYTDNIMILSSTKYALRVTNNVGIHNDILRTYIGWGCIPFLYYFYNLFVLNLKRIRKNFKNADVWLYFAIVGYAFVNYMVDYMITYMPFNICMFAIFLLINREG